jgi:EmrB/QacA subfamily drug resistance transporter
MAAGDRAQKPHLARASIDSLRAGHRVRRFGEPGRSLSMSSETEGAGRYRLVPLIVSSALFMQNLDSTVLTTALPTIARDFGADPLHLKLALTSYLMALAVFVPASGWIADRFGARPVFQAALGVFALGSAGCALSWDLASLVGARLVQGIGGAMMLPVARLLVLRSVPRGEMVAAFAMLSMPALVAPIMGPPVGGFLTSFLSWHWIFWINLPIAAIGAALAARHVPRLPPDAPASFDVVGFLLVGPGLALVLTGITLLDMDLLGRAALAAILGLGVAMLVLYVAWARRHPAAPIDLRLLRIPTFRAGILGGLFFRVGVGASPFLLPLLLQEGFGRSAFEAGLVTFGAGVGALAMKPLAPRIVGAAGFRHVLLANAVLSSLLVAVPGLFRPDWAAWALFGALLAGGFSRSLQFTTVNALLYADVPREDLSRATTFGSVMQELAGTFGVATAALALAAMQDMRGRAGLDALDFPVVFALVGAISLASALAFLRLPADAGRDLARRGGG